MKVGDTVRRNGYNTTHIVGRVSRWGVAYSLCDDSHLPKDECLSVKGAATCSNCLARAAKDGAK